MPRVASFCALVAALIGVSSAGCSAEIAPRDPRSSESPASYPMPSTPPSPTAPASEPRPSPAPVGLDVETSTELFDLGDAHPADGNVFLAVTVVVRNGLEQPLPIPWSELSLRTRRGSVVAPSVASSALPDACGDVVEPSASRRCTAAFEVPQNEAMSLVLALPSGEEIEATVLPPTVCNIVARRGAPAKVRVSTDAPHALEQADVPDGTFVLVRAELYTERPRESFMLPASTVVLRDGVFQEVVFGDVTTRTLGRIDSREGGVAKLSCATPEAAAEPPHDWISYWKDAGELVLERILEDGAYSGPGSAGGAFGEGVSGGREVLRRIYRQE